MYFIALWFAIFGGIVGSFLNVVVLRKGVSTLSGRSQCPSCGKTIAAYDLVPVFSWILLRGRCRYCGSRISIQYPLVEAATAILYALIGVAAFPNFLLSGFAFLTLCVQLVIVSLLVAITVYDMRHTIIPDEWSYAYAALAFVLALIQSPMWMTLVYGPIAAFPLFFLWFISQGRWMGLGDPKLALGIGWLLGFPLGVIAVFFSFILGSVILVPIMLYERIVTHKVGEAPTGAGLTMKSEVPFGPFLIASCLIFWVLGLYGIGIPLYLIGY